jgi:hypothetical protein
MIEERSEKLRDIDLEIELGRYDHEADRQEILDSHKMSYRDLVYAKVPVII